MQQKPNFIISLQWMEVSNNFAQPCEATLDVKGQPRPLFRLFFVFSNKQYNFYNKSMWKNVHPI